MCREGGERQQGHRIHETAGGVRQQPLSSQPTAPHTLTQPWQTFVTNLTDFCVVSDTKIKYSQQGTRTLRPFLEQEVL